MLKNANCTLVIKRRLLVGTLCKVSYTNKRKYTLKRTYKYFKILL